MAVLVMRRRPCLIRGFLPLGLLALAAAASLALAAGPVLVDGLAPDTVAGSASQCRSCDVDRARSGLCQNECVTCRDARVPHYAGREGCEAYAFNRDLCASYWVLTADGVPVGCYFKGLFDVSCRPCTGAEQLSHNCTNICLPCADTGRTRVATSASPEDSCRSFDGNQSACEAAWQLAFHGVPIACFYAAGECHACRVAQQLAGQCTNTCLPCEAASRTTYADGSGDDPCLALAGNRAACESSWYLDAGSLPTSCFYTAGTEPDPAGVLFIQDGFDRIGPLVTNGRKLAICIGCNGTMAIGGFEHGLDGSTLAGLGWTRTILTDPGAIDAFFAGTGTPSIADAGIVYMPSQQTDSHHDGISEEQVAVANARAAELAAFVQRGGGLFVHNQAGLKAGFAWLGAVLPGVSARSAATCRGGLSFTTSGADRFPDLIDANLQALNQDRPGYFIGTGGGEMLAADECRDVTCKDPSHPNFLGGPDDSLCAQLAGDTAGCNAAWYLASNGLPGICKAAAAGACVGCAPTQPDSNPCLVPVETDMCAACDDPAHTKFLGDLFRGECNSLNFDSLACGIAWVGTSDGTNASCFYDAHFNTCDVCSPTDESQGLCSNLCDPPVATRAVILGPAAPGPTFESILSRLEQLIAVLRDARDLGGIEKQLERAALKAHEQTVSAQSLASGKRKKTKRSLREASRRMASFDVRVCSRRARRVIPEPTRTALRTLEGAILADLRALRRSL